MGKIASTLFLGFVLTTFAAPSSLSALVGKALRLDEVQLWKRALSRAEVEQNMKQTLTGIEFGSGSLLRF